MFGNFKRIFNDVKLANMMAKYAKHVGMERGNAALSANPSAFLDSGRTCQPKQRRSTGRSWSSVNAGPARN